MLQNCTLCTDRQSDILAPIHLQDEGWFSLSLTSGEEAAGKGAKLRELFQQEKTRELEASWAQGIQL